ncbi:PDDEXK nuclease domain-containing protein [uncultured Ruminococcus sp.]|uniref:PDDEXK nuclease domain-containing protein n=1 Tax=uncultured Ruminococcus sp. TaxID=165186 RepID=UPI0025CFCF9B|nr:PDDEXK nuclease domain-containing protein [uncultured Ruminococcus sp.]
MDNGIIKAESNSEEIYTSIRSFVITAQNRVYTAVNSAIGIVLCAEKNDAVVKYTLPEGNDQIFASKYFTYLPTEEELKRELRIDEFHKLDEESIIVQADVSDRRQI